MFGNQRAKEKESGPPVPPERGDVKSLRQPDGRRDLADPKWINEDGRRRSKPWKRLCSENPGIDAALQAADARSVRLSRSKADSVRVPDPGFFTELAEYINIAKKYVELEDFSKFGRIVFMPDSHGNWRRAPGLHLAGSQAGARRVKTSGTG